MTEAARKLTAVFEAFRRGGPNLKATHLQVMDELGLPEPAAAKWKEKIETECDEAAPLKAKRKAEGPPKLRRRPIVVPDEGPPNNSGGPQCFWE
jgi:hypothetical protein